MSDALLLLALSALAALWGYLVYRNYRFGEFRRWGRGGWFNRVEHPQLAKAALVGDSLYLIILLLVIGWVFVGKPNL